MTQWSQDELNRTIDEVKRRCLINSSFRTLALTHPADAIAKINPKPLPDGLVVKFIEISLGEPSSIMSGGLTIVLPEPLEQADELSDAELEQAAGGRTDIKFPPEW